MLFILGSANLAFGVWTLRRAQRFRDRGIRVSGLVTGLERSSDPDSNACYPVFRFTTRDGREVEITSRYGESKPPRPGDHVTVLYDPEKERNARIDTGGQDGSTIGMWVVGIGLFLITLGVLTTFRIV
ncbi:DUF3592 domain-containing protein [Nonomuraea sp. NPDC048826]|uniref:DUF3592 domain-containing protein n=1 Tax=Nonomuraea sp. NPDC048826 TaxID=3364347 RepID=UPI00371E6225